MANLDESATLRHEDQDWGSAPSCRLVRTPFETLVMGAEQILDELTAAKALSDARQLVSDPAALGRNVGRRLCCYIFNSVTFHLIAA